MPLFLCTFGPKKFLLNSNSLQAGGICNFVKESVCAPCCSATWKRDLGPRCGPAEVFSFLPVVQMLCDSTMFSGSCSEQSQTFILCVSILDQSLAQDRSQLEPFGSSGLVTLHGIAEALRFSNFSCGIIQDVFITKNIAWNEVGFALRAFLTCLTTPPVKYLHVLM